MEEFTSVLEKKSIAIDEWDVIPYKDKKGILNFASVKEVYMLENDWKYEVFTKETFTEVLDINFLSSIDVERSNNILELAKYCGFDMYPLEEEFADWAENIAEHLLNINSTYDT